MKLAVVIAPPSPGPPAAGTIIAADGDSQVTAAEVIINTCQLLKDEITTSEGAGIEGIGRGDGCQALRKITSRDPSGRGGFGIDRVGQSGLLDGHEGRDIPIIMSLYGRAHFNLVPSSGGGCRIGNE